MKHILQKTTLSLAAFLLLFSAKAQFDIPGLKKDCNVAAKYTFSSNVVMKISSKSEYLEEPMDMVITMAMNDVEQQMGMTMSSAENPMLSGMNTIVDMQDSVVLVLMEFGGEKKGMCMDLTSKEFSDKVAEQQKENPDFTKFKKTGNTKVILTYNCEEFQYTSDKMSMTMWLTNDVENVFKNFSSGLGNAPGGFQMPAGMTGQMMAMHQVDNEKNIVVDLEVTEINRNETTELSTEGFDFK